MKSKPSLLVLSGTALLLMSNSASGASIYDNNISALNINMLTDVFMSYTDYGAKMSDLFVSPETYGTMTRLDEYGDDGSTISTFDSERSNDKYLFKNVWLNANHINASMHYGNNISLHGRFNLATIGATTHATELKYGKISFGGFASYINTKMPDVHSNGDVAGLFADYQYRALGIKALANTGSLNNNADNMDFNNSWLNVAMDISGTFKIDNTFFVRPGVYAGYTFVSSDDLHIAGNRVYSKDYNFFNVSPALTFIKEISPKWYGALSAKYVAHMGGKNDINIGNNSIDGLKLDNHTDVGIDLEHDYKQFVFGAKVHKQVGGIDGWSTNINVKYAF